MRQSSATVESHRIPDRGGIFYSKHVGVYRKREARTGLQLELDVGPAIAVAHGKLVSVGSNKKTGARLVVGLRRGLT